MSEPIRFRDIRLEGGCIIIRPEREDLGKAMTLMKGIKKKLYVLSVKEHRNKRSLDANQKMWALIHEMSTMIKLTPEEIYQGYIPDVGNNYRVFPVKPEEINEFAADWCNGHIGRMVDDMGPCRQLGIETMSERERSLLMEEWEATYADRHQGTVYTKGSQNPGS